MVRPQSVVLHRSADSGPSCSTAPSLFVLASILVAVMHASGTQLWSGLVAVVISKYDETCNGPEMQPSMAHCQKYSCGSLVALA